MGSNTGLLSKIDGKSQDQFRESTKRPFTFLVLALLVSFDISVGRNSLLLHN